MRSILPFLLIQFTVQAFQPSSLSNNRVVVTPTGTCRTTGSCPQPRGSIGNSLRVDDSSSQKPTTTGIFQYTESRLFGSSQVAERRSRRDVLRKRFGGWIRRAFASLAIFFFVHFSSISPAWAGKSGGRMGGSFKPSSSRSYGSYSRTPSRISRPPMRSAPIRSYYRPAPRIIIHNRPPVHVYASPVEAPVEIKTSYAQPVRRGVTMSDVVLMTGSGALITYGVMNHYQNNGGPRSALGPGASVMSLTVCLNVPDRDNPSSILSALTRRAELSWTGTRKGVQTMISETALMLLRQETAIVSAGSEYKHFRSVAEAQREFNSLSIIKRSKFDRESASNFGGQKQIVHDAAADGNSGATVAVVTINLCIEGDSSTQLSKIRTRQDLKDALSRVASDSQVEECLLSGEVLWTPEDRSDTLTREEVYEDYPTLWMLDSY